jgi:SRSO17 transposase
MEPTEFERVATSFAAFHREFAPLFGRKEAQQRSEQYLRGLLVQQTDRRNAENLAETITGATPRTLQRFLTEAPWSSAPVIEHLQRYLGQQLRLSTPEGVFILDDTGFAKQGTKSVGVARQYSGTLGKIGNCQVGVFLAYAAEHGHALVDKALYLPHAWTDDPARCQAAGVPPQARTYQSKAELGLQLLRQARQWGHLGGRWVTADEDYGKVPSFRDALDAEGWWYVLEVQCTTQVFEQAAKTEVRQWVGNGRPPTKTRLVRGEPRPVAVEVLAAQVPADEWQELSVAEGAQGPRRYQFVARHVWEHREGIPGRECWLILRRNLDHSELKFYFSNAPPEMPLLTLAQVGALRWTIETEFQTEKGETGLDEYEARSWRSWQHHITLALLAGAFLLSMQQEWGGKDAPDHPPASESGAAGAITAAQVDPPRTLVLAG